jgi:hypothetical protein
MRLPRMTTRRWMVVVFLVGVFTQGAILAQRSWRAWKLVRTSCILAEIYSDGEKDLRVEVAESNSKLILYEHPLSTLAYPGRRKPPEDEARSDAVHWRAAIAAERFRLSSTQAALDMRSSQRRYYEQLERKYRRAVWHPWLPVDPDPPVPEFDPVTFLRLP